MGLLDSLLSGSQGGGLLDFLRNNAMSQQFSSGLPSDQAQYGGSPSNTFAQLQPNPAMMQPSVPQQPPPVIQAQPTQAPLQAQPQTPLPTVGDGYMDRIHNGGSLIGSLFGDSRQQQAQNLTLRALVQRGVDPTTAQAAIGNPDLLKALVTQNFGQSPHKQEVDKDGNVWDVNQQTGQRTIALAAPKDNFGVVQTGQDPLGQKTYQKLNKSTGDMTPVSGDSGTPGLPQFGSLLAQGVQYDPNKTGDEYMAQFGPEVQAAAKAYIRGDVMPSGNARMNAIATFAKSVAQKWGQDKGIPVNDQTFSGKRTMANQLAMSSNSSMGGILSNGESSFKHLAEATDSMADLGNASHDFPLGGYVAHAQNALTNSTGGSDKFAKIGAIVDNLGKYGSESTKFYAGTGGGVEERTAARKDLNPNKVSGEEMASYAAKEKSLMLDRLETKFQEIRNTYGEEEGNRIIAKHMPDIQKNIAKIDTNVARLRGSTPTAQTPDRSAIETEMRRRGLLK